MRSQFPTALYGKIIYANNLKELEKIYQSALKNNSINSYHTLYYTIAKKRFYKGL